MVAAVETAEKKLRVGSVLREQSRIGRTSGKDIFFFVARNLPEKRIWFAARVTPGRKGDAIQ